MRRAPLAAALLFGVLAGPLAYAGVRAGAQAGVESKAQARLIGKAAPGFVREDLSGKKVSLSGYRGKVVLLNFWATWCAPCVIEIPAFARWQSRYGGQGLQVIGISMDDDAPPVRAMYRRLKVNYPVAMGDEKIGELYGGVLGLPVTYLIDREGRIVSRYQGEADLKWLEREVLKLLGKP
jgi:thiol-disulfide isomerase/thioredoxin